MESQIPTTFSRYIRRGNLVLIYKKFEKCKCLTNEEKGDLIEFVRESEREELNSKK